MLVFRERIGLDVGPRGIAGTIGKTFFTTIGKCWHQTLDVVTVRARPRGNVFHRKNAAVDSGSTPNTGRTSDLQQRTRRKGSLYCAARRSRVGLLIQT